MRRRRFTPEFDLLSLRIAPSDITGTDPGDPTLPPADTSTTDTSTTDTSTTDTTTTDTDPPPPDPVYDPLPAPDPPPPGG